MCIGSGARLLQLLRNVFPGQKREAQTKSLDSSKNASFLVSWIDVVIQGGYGENRSIFYRVNHKDKTVARIEPIHLVSEYNRNPSITMQQGIVKDLYICACSKWF